MRGYVQSRSDLPLPGCVTIAQGALTGFIGVALLAGQAATSRPSASPQVSGGGLRSAGQRDGTQCVAVEAVGSFIADGAGGGQ